MYTGSIPVLASIDPFSPCFYENKGQSARPDTLEDTTLMSYNPSSLVCLKHKKSIWYVQVTEPLELQRPNDKQIRRSNGTTDLREAERRKHKITEEIYALFDYEIDRRKPHP